MVRERGKCDKWGRSIRVADPGCFGRTSLLGRELGLFLRPVSHVFVALCDAHKYFPYSGIRPLAGNDPKLFCSGTIVFRQLQWLSRQF